MKFEGGGLSGAIVLLLTTDPIQTRMQRNGQNKRKDDTESKLSFESGPFLVICQLYHEFRKNLIFRKLYVICSDIHFLLSLIVNPSILGGEFIASMSHTNGK